MVLLYSFAVSVLTIGGLLLHLAMELSLHWNPQFYLKPIPFHLTFASAYILGLNGLWNLHIVTLLLMLARSTNNSGQSDTDYSVRPVTYTCRSLDQVHLQDVAGGAPGQLLLSGDECVLDSLTSNHFSSGESKMLRRQSSEDFLEMQAARGHCRTQCRHYYVDDDDRDFSSASSPDDPYHDEIAGMKTIIFGFN